MARFKILAIFIAVFGLLFAGVGTANAARPHTVPSGDAITCTVNDADLSVTCTGELAGLGNVKLINVHVETGFACATRGNANQPGGHVQGDSGPIQVNNGRATFTVDTGPASCPPGLNPVVGATSTITVTDLRTGKVIYTVTVPNQ